MLFNLSLDIIPSLFLQDMLEVGMERRLHIPPGSAYTKMFPDPRSGDCKYQTCVWADTLTYNATVACDPFYKHWRFLVRLISLCSVVMRGIWKTMEGKDHYTVYDKNMNYNADFVKEKIIEKKGLFLHTREMHAWVYQRLSSIRWNGTYITFIWGSMVVRSAPRGCRVTEVITVKMILPSYSLVRCDGSLVSTRT